MIILTLNKYNCTEQYKYKISSLKFLEKLYCDEKFIESIHINDELADINDLKKNYLFRKKAALTQRKWKLIDIKFYLQTNVEATKRCNDELALIEKRIKEI
jgi:hypothetical protein